jgi:hypothetical protein
VKPLSDALNKSLGYGGVEFVYRINRDTDYNAVAETREAGEREPIGMRLWLHQREDDLDTLIASYAPLGTDTFVTPYCPETKVRNATRVQQFVRRLERVGKNVTMSGLNPVYRLNYWDLMLVFDGPILGRIPPLRVIGPTHSVLQELTVEQPRNGDDANPDETARRVKNIRAEDPVRPVRTRIETLWSAGLQQRAPNAGPARTIAA